MGPSQVFDAEESLLLQLPERQVPKRLNFPSNQELRQHPLKLPGWQLSQTMEGAFQGVLNEIVELLPTGCCGCQKQTPIQGAKRGVSGSSFVAILRRQPL